MTDKFPFVLKSKSPISFELGEQVQFEDDWFTCDEIRQRLDEKMDVVYIYCFI